MSCIHFASIILHILNANQFIEFRDKGVISTVCKTWNVTLLNSNFWKEIHITKRCNTKESYYEYMQSLYIWTLKMNIYLDKINKVVINQGPKKQCGLFYKICRNIIIGKNITILEITDISHIPIIEECSQTLIELKINIIDDECDTYNYKCNGECDETCKSHSYNDDTNEEFKQLTNINLADEEVIIDKINDDFLQMANIDMSDELYDAYNYDRNAYQEYSDYSFKEYLTHCDCNCIGEEYQLYNKCEHFESQFRNIHKGRYIDVPTCFGLSTYLYYSSYMEKYSVLYQSINYMYNNIFFPKLLKYHINLNISTTQYTFVEEIGKYFLNINYRLLANASNLTSLTYSGRKFQISDLSRITNNFNMFKEIYEKYRNLTSFDLDFFDFKIKKINNVIEILVLNKHIDKINQQLRNLCNGSNTIKQVHLDCLYVFDENSRFWLSDINIDQLIIECACKKGVVCARRHYVVNHELIKHHINCLQQYVEVNKKYIKEVILDQSLQWYEENNTSQCLMCK